MFHFVLFVLYLYVVCRFVFPLPWCTRCRVLLAAVLLLTSKYHLIQQWVFGTMFSPEMPRALVMRVVLRLRTVIFPHGNIRRAAGSGLAGAAR